MKNAVAGQQVAATAQTTAVSAKAYPNGIEINKQRVQHILI